MGTVVLISTVAIVVAIVGCFFIWRLDASRADEVENTSPPPPTGGTRRIAAQPQPKRLDS